ncbi:Ser/Thr protein phosphatase family protein [Synechococcus sp. PCC 7335]|uniref:TIGR04168 family protein n=1 Tax=Synechococcus sp. (strain ATCC 29403 / PCC 7335) TaxID=91464 RepID=UPI00017EDD4A|nr:TIGR04168 family protein [Synechococcus sp. PCC 7335]EDX85425.1 Ser/Thr protein phosphatase family protein [Synechococcus sp. PCC 7335]
MSHSIVKIAVIGDIHDLWELEDNAALEHLEVDLALFVGDYGNEAVEVVRRIAAVEVPKAAVMGNHDAYYSASAKGVQNCPYDREKEDWVQLQMDLLGEAHIGFGKREFPQFGLTVVGGRPFSWGGSKWRYRKFYRDRFDINSFDESLDLILAAADEAEHSTIIFVGHVGPYGLGDRPGDPCGKDWGKNGGDYGDPDFADAIALTQAAGKQVPLVTFGHMHHQLKNSDQLRTRVASDTKGTIYFNAANVPRIEATSGGERRSFSLVTLNQGTVESINLVWVDSSFTQVSQEQLYARTSTVVSSSAE